MNESGENMKYQVSSLIANLAITAGKAPATVVVAGCDEIGAICGLAQVIAGHYAEEDLRVMVVGCGRVDASEETLLAASENYDVKPFAGEDRAAGGIAADDAFMHALGDFAQEYDRVIIAAPYAHKTIDAAMVSRVADATVLVAVESQTRRKDLKKASGELKRAGAHIAGVCMVEGWEA